MNAKIAKIRKFVDENRTYLAFCAGSITTSTIIILLTKDKTMLAVTRDQMQLVKQGGAIVYDLKDQTQLHLINIPAVEARQALLNA